MTSPRATGVTLSLETKKKILGLNAARLYGIDVEAQKARLANSNGSAGGVSPERIPAAAQAAE